MKRPIRILRCFLSAFVLFGTVNPVYAQKKSLSTQAIEAAAKEDYKAARNMAKDTANPKVLKLIEWMRLTNNKDIAPFPELQRFMEKNPNWPRIYVIRRNAEQALLKEGNTAALEKWFRKHPPVSPEAVLIQADILLAKKDWEKAMPILYGLWMKGDLADENFAVVQEKLQFVLNEHDYAARMDRLLWSRNVAQATGLLKFVADEDRRLAQARIDFMTNHKNARKSLKDLPTSHRYADGVLFDQLRWLRQRQRYSDAVKLLKTIPPEKQKESKWWTERSLLIRQLLSKKNYDDAYALARGHALTKGSDYADAEWLAGWIALRNLKKRDKAIFHFKRMLEAVKSPVSIARGEYWLGRSYEAQGKKDEAIKWYEKSAQKITTIYGQLAATKLNKEIPALPSETEPSREFTAKIRRTELYAMMKLLEEAKQYELVDLFATRIYNDTKSPEEKVALTHLLAKDLKREDLAVTFSRRARQNGIHLVSLGYPVWNVNCDKNAEQAMVLSIIRQESNFASHAVSPAGARGLMQIMPSTAKQVAQKKKKSFTPQMLNDSTEYNIDIGSTYFAELVKRFKGSYILAAAAYNAGPTNVNRWLKSFGSPEDMDPIDWIEMIPFSETRNYVQRVLENLHIYRRHLNYPETDLLYWKKPETKAEEN